MRPSKFLKIHRKPGLKPLGGGSYKFRRQKSQNPFSRSLHEVSKPFPENKPKGSKKFFPGAEASKTLFKIETSNI